MFVHRPLPREGFLGEEWEPILQDYDYIIIGAGSAGSVLADRLSADGRARVLIVESGGMDRSPYIHLPVGYGRLFYDKRWNYGLTAEPQDALNNRADYWPRGHVVGGSGSINAMVYCRGLPHDFDDWEAAGAKGWNWETVRATYDRIETRVAPDGSTEGNGALHVSDVSDRIHPLNRHYFKGLEELQLPVTANMNGNHPEGGGVYQINTKNGRRWSSARAHLHPALKRKNVTLCTRTRVLRIVFDGRRAVGVELRQKSSTEIVRAREVILSAGAVHSPGLLQRSGIGPGALLQSLGITPVVANDNVGGNLQDHQAVSYYYRATEPTLNNDLAPFWGKVKAAIQYALTRKGPLSLSVNQSGGFLRSSPDLPHADQQIYFNPVTYTVVGYGKRTVINPDPFPGFILCAQPARPTSRGRIDIRSANPDAPPMIVPNSLATPEDEAQVIGGGRLVQRLASAPAIAKLIEAPMGPDVRPMSDAEILADFRARSGTVYHPVSTCRMGASAETAVIDAECRVFGIEGLRVVDASSFPNITSGNTNAPTMMLAHRAADLILGQGR